eukprot:scaffold8477_cov286-Pinguiococcus_pyrenoidosus.AAC.2
MHQSPRPRPIQSQSQSQSFRESPKSKPEVKAQSPSPKSKSRRNDRRLFWRSCELLRLQAPGTAQGPGAPDGLFTTIAVGKGKWLSDATAQGSETRPRIGAGPQKLWSQVILLLAYPLLLGHAQVWEA